MPSARIRQRGDRQAYDVKDADCLGRSCLRLHPIQVRGATMSGSRNTGGYHYGCAERNYYGCPQPIPEPDKEIARARRSDGMRLVR